jgi:hypothetical protein
MANKSKQEKYTDPDLRERIKEEIKASDKGGMKGQWSARKPSFSPKSTRSGAAATKAIRTNLRRT